MEHARMIGLVFLSAALAWPTALPGKPKRPVPAPLKLDPDPVKAFSRALLPRLGADDLAARTQAHLALERICRGLLAPDKRARRAALCKAMVAALGGDTPKCARIIVLGELEIIGGAECVPGADGLLADRDRQIRQRALRVLASSPSPAAGEKLRAALAAARDAKWRIALIQALGRRGEAAGAEAGSAELTAGALIKLLADRDEPVAAAVAAALGKIGGPAAIEALAAAGKSARAKVRAAALDAYLACAYRLEATGARGPAERIFRELYAPGVPKRFRIAAAVSAAACCGPTTPAP